MDGNQPEMLTIGEVAQLAGVQTSTLRYYESIGLLPAPRRVSGQRRYTTAVLPLLAVIQLAKEANFSLPEIETLLHGQSENGGVSARWRELAARKIQELDAVIVRAQDMRALLQEALTCDALQFELDQVQPE
ncbi:MAG: MerR family transcriptional regulator [Anaerolineae bacterium]